MASITLYWLLHSNDKCNSLTFVFFSYLFYLIFTNISLLRSMVHPCVDRRKMRQMRNSCNHAVALHSITCFSSFVFIECSNFRSMNALITYTVSLQRVSRFWLFCTDMWIFAIARKSLTNECNIVIEREVVVIGKFWSPFLTVIKSYSARLSIWLVVKVSKALIMTIIGSWSITHNTKGWHWQINNNKKGRFW